MNPRSTMFIVDDLCCASEELLIRKKLQAIEGVEIRGINIVEKTVNLNHNCSTEKIIEALNDAGMRARLLDAEQPPQTVWERYSGLLFIIISALFMLAGFIFSVVLENAQLSAALFTASILCSGWNILLKGVKAIKHVSLDMNFLMTIATIGAVAIGKWEEGAVVMFLFALSEQLERYSMKRSREAIHSLMKLAPTVVRVKRNNEISVVDVKKVAIGERIFIQPGERIPLDGDVIAGASSVNQAPITGESAPVFKQAGDAVFAGSYNQQGALEIKTTKLHNDTMLARIVRLVEEAQESRAPISSLVDKFARVYAPAVFGIACLIAIVPPVVAGKDFAEWFYRALVLLVIACPCALVLSTPVTIMSGIANAARHGALIKGGRFLELLGSVKAIAFDKTGTLTIGKPVVTDVFPLNSLSKEEIVNLTSIIEDRSEHHLAGAVRHKATQDNHGLTNIHAMNFESLTGKGVRAIVDKKTYVVGSHRLIEEMKICTPDLERVLEQFENEGKTTLILATELEPLGVIAVADEIRPESKSVIQQLRGQGIEKIILLTGDNQSTARSIARQTGIDEVMYEVLPDEKMNQIAELKKHYGTVAMVGDGVNDAPALASSTIGIAMGKTGAGISLEAADIVLMSDDISRLPFVMSLSKKTLSIIKQNIAIALVTKVVFLLLGVFGTATLWMAIIADDGATLAVILNGLRALRLKEENG